MLFETASPLTLLTTSSLPASSRLTRTQQTYSPRLQWSQLKLRDLGSLTPRSPAPTIVYDRIPPLSPGKTLVFAFFGHATPLQVPWPQQTLLQRCNHRLSPVCGPEFAQNVGDVVLNGLVGDAKLQCYFPVGQTAEHQPQYVAFPVGERLGHDFTPNANHVVASTRSIARPERVLRHRLNEVLVDGDTRQHRPANGARRR